MGLLMGMILGEHGRITIVKLMCKETVNIFICVSFSADLTMKEVQ